MIINFTYIDNTGKEQLQSCGGNPEKAEKEYDKFKNKYKYVQLVAITIMNEEKKFLRYKEIIEFVNPRNLKKTKITEVYTKDGK